MPPHPWVDVGGMVPHAASGSSRFPFDEPFEHWRRARDWPRYDFNNGQTRGLPVTLRKLYDACPWAHLSHAQDEAQLKEGPP